ncbi:MAG TPA: ATP-binding protein [Oligoflexus sp.]|uniref:ATP-binding protein n=1 Tax=Oligoflexus sp. TaxID=1971216 RepID=UPI002D5AFFF0|nr:ATP-binding protein [Oligoflexus sp.]HYX33980.1 ATP-binding protein [Oligoflexus sp.]
MQQSQTLAIISDLLNTSKQTLNSFFSEANVRIEKVKQRIADLHGTIESMDPGIDIHEIFREIHTVKGGARIAKLGKLSHAAHEVEEVAHQIREGGTVHKDALIQSVDVLGEVFSLYYNVFNHVFTASEIETAPSLLSILVPHQQRILSDLHRAKLKYGGFAVEDDSIDWSEAEIRSLNEMFCHIFSNILDHSFIIPRDKSGFICPPVKITISCVRKRGWKEIRIADNGRGIDLDSVKKRALQRGIPLSMLTNDEAVLSILFSDGFSTANEVTATSGRGVGLSAIRKLAEDLGGHASIANHSAGGAVLMISFPTHESQHALKYA